jgi:hypothetical protein
MIGPFNYEAFTLQELHDQVNGGRGAGVVQPAVDGLLQYAPVIGASADRLRQSMSAARVEWRSQAADAASSAMGAATGWADSAGELGRAGSRHVGDYLSSWAGLKNQIPAPEPVPTLSTWGRFVDIFGTNSDHAKVIAANANEHANAVAAMQRHEGVANSTLDGFAEVAPVPQLIAAAPPVTQPKPPPKSVRPPGTVTPPPGKPGTDPVGMHTAPGGPPPVGPGHARVPVEPGGTSPADYLPPVPTPTPGDPGGTGFDQYGPAPTPGDSAGTGFDQHGPAPTPVRDPYNYYPPGGFDSILNPKPTPQPQQPPQRVAGQPTTAPSEPRTLVASGAAAAAGAEGKGLPGGLPPVGGAGKGGQEKEHRNNTFIPTAEHFMADVDDDVAPPVITPEYLAKRRERRERGEG